MDKTVSGWFRTYSSGSWGVVVFFDIMWSVVVERWWDTSVTGGDGLWVQTQEGQDLCTSVVSTGDQSSSRRGDLVVIQERCLHMYGNSDI